MKHFTIFNRLALIAVLLVGSISSSASAQSSLSTVIPYQGQLNVGGTPANSPHDFEFKLFDAATAGTQIGSTNSKENVEVKSGNFAVELDFGGSAFNGGGRFLQIGVRAGDSTGAFTTLTPRRPLLAVPYALYSPSGSKPAYGMAANAPNDAAYVASNGNVGVGITTPTDKLHVAGHIHATGSLVLDGPNAQNILIGAEPSVNEIVIATTNPGVKFVRLIHWPTNNHMGLVTSHLVVHNKTASGITPIWFEDGSGTHWEAGINLPNSPAGSFAIGVAAGARMFVESNGKVTMESLKLFKEAEVGVLKITGGADLAEPFDMTDHSKIEPGMVVTIDPDNPGQLRLANGSYDRMVAGVVSGAGGVNSGLIMQQEGTIAAGEHPVALTGRVYVWVDASQTPVNPGDLLTTSNTPGHAMKVTDHSKAQGAILGKAMGTLEKGKGLVLMLVSLQ